MNIRQIAFFDIETVGRTATYSDLEKEEPRMAELWALWQEKYKETNGNASINDVWVQKAGLHAEYGKVVCVSFGYYDKEMIPRMTSFYGDDEREILQKTAGVMNNSDHAGMYLGGHNIDRFDVPFLWKRMLSHGITPPAIINVWDKKPWDLKFFDTAKVWSGGVWKESFTSLDTVTAVFDVESPKKDMKATEVHSSYWVKKEIEKIKMYCEGDVKATMEVSKQILEITTAKLQEA